MKEFWEDYKDLCKQTGQFYKKHWKGLLAVNAVIAVAEGLYFKHQIDSFNKRLEDSE